ncbi:hypothetical protein ACI65C_001227 [Semiaphis heraclei]
MYNTRSSSGASHGNQYNIRKVETFKQQQQHQQQTMTNVANCITPKTASQMKNQVQQQPISLHDAPLESTCPKPIVETQIPTTSVTQTSPVQDFKDKQIKLEEEGSISEKSDVKWPIKRKINKKERKKRLNARMRRLVTPKSPLMVFSELFKDVPILLQEQIIDNVMLYIATFEIDGHSYTAHHVSKTQAKQKACENFLRIMLAKKISERSEKKEESPIETEMEDGENGTVSKQKGPPQEDFPWPHFASLAMHNLIHQWELQPVSKSINLQEEQLKAIKLPPKPKAGPMRKFPDDPRNCNPIQLINQMKPGVKFIETIISFKTPSVFQVKCEIDNVPFIGQDKIEKLNKRETLNQLTDALDYYSFSSDTNVMYYSDSEGSKLLILPQKNEFVHNVPSALHTPSSSDFDIDYCKMMNYKPLATSSPLSKLRNKIRNKYYWKKTSKKLSVELNMSNNDNKSKSSKVNKRYNNSDTTISSYYTSHSTDTSNLLHKTVSSKYNSPLIGSENQEKTNKHTNDTTFNSIKQVSQKTLNDVTNIIHTNQTQSTLHKSNFTTNTTLNKKSKNNNSFQLNLVSDKTINLNLTESNKMDLVCSLKDEKSSMKNKTEGNQTLHKNTTIKSNRSQMTYNINKHMTFDESFLNLHKSNFTTNTTLNKKSENNNSFQLNLVSDKTINSNLNESNKMDLVCSLKDEKSSMKNKTERNQTLHKNTTIISNRSQMTYNINNHMTFDESFLKNTDLSDIFQMELSLKMFSGNIVPYLNSMKHEILQIMNKCMYKHDGQIIERSKHVNEIIENIHNVMKTNSMYNCIDSSSNKKDYSTIPFVGVDLNNLNVLNDKLECINKKLEQFKFPLSDNMLNDQKDKSINQFYVQNDFLEFNKSRDDLKSLKSATGNANDIISLNKTAELDSSSCIRGLNKSNSLLRPVSDCININESSEKNLLENCSLLCMNELPINEISKAMAQDLSHLSYNEPLLNKLTPINNNNSINFEGVNNNDNSVEKNQNHYWLRNNPKSTEHYFSPFPRNPFKTQKKPCIKSRYNDMFICKGTGNNKVVHQYKLKTVLKANSEEFMKIIGPDSKNKKSINDNLSTTIFDISNLKPKKIEKPCRCGIYPSQVPSSWNDSLHTTLHKSLNKLQFKSQVTVNIASKINLNGFLFDIIKVTENCDDLSLRLTLKNIQDFIHLEIDCSKRSINNLDHTIFLAVNPKFKIIGYLETEPLKNACIYQNNQLSTNLIAVKFGISKLWVMVKYRNNGIATKLLNQFCDEENLKTSDIAFAYHGNHGIAFIKKYFANNSVLIY